MGETLIPFPTDKKRYRMLVEGTLHRAKGKCFILFTRHYGNHGNEAQVQVDVPVLDS